MEIMISPVDRQWTVCGPVRFVFEMISSGEITLCIFGRRGSATSMMWMRVDFRPGTTRNRRMCFGSPWQLLHAFQPK